MLVIAILMFVHLICIVMRLPLSMSLHEHLTTTSHITSLHMTLMTGISYILLSADYSQASELSL